MQKGRLIIVALAVAVAGSANAGWVYGINDAANGGGIYRINMLTGQSSLVTATSGGQPNGLASDLAGGNLYWGAGSGNRTLRRYSIAGNTTTVLTGSLAKNTASGAWYNGSYYYVAEGTRELRRVNITGNAITGESVLLNPSESGWGFGDIDITADGKVYGSTTNNVFWQADLGNLAAGYTILSTTHGDRLQLGFFGSTLYGVGSDDDRLFSVALANGARTLTSTLTDRSLRITDAAAAPVPEPGTIAALGLGAMALLRRRKKA